MSTGGVQSLFVAINEGDAYQALIKAYSPDAESEVVNRPNNKLLTVVTGAMAGLAPLRRRIEHALCTKGDPALGCPLIERLAQAPRQVFIGYIRASDGKFLYADAVAIARQIMSADRSVATARNAQQCLTGVAMASAAMPTFYQQVQINRKTYFDGGVRKSVFVAGVAGLIDRGVAEAERQEARKALLEKRNASTVTPPPFYVIRNGPTELLNKQGLPDTEPASDNRLNALDAAMRAEAIVVNELEVGSIAALRLIYPRGDIHLATADGYHAWPRPNGDRGCTKPKDIMFDPGFMLCLQDLGRAKAHWPTPWITLDPIAAQRRTPRP